MDRGNPVTLSVILVTFWVILSSLTDVTLTAQTKIQMAEYDMKCRAAEAEKLLIALSCYSRAALHHTEVEDGLKKN